MLSESIAERYAEALFQTAQEHGQVRDWERYLLLVCESIQSHTFLGKVLYSPQIAPEVKKEILSKVFLKTLPPSFLNFFLFLADKGRERYLESIRNAYSLKVQELEGMLTARITVASPLSPALEAGLALALSRHTGKRVKLSTSLDPDLIGGVVIRMEDMILDWSISGHLQNLKEKMVGSPAG
jgi:F-type H+-transporting ATPase subunit delta